jgi:hypothetical protein
MAAWPPDAVPPLSLRCVVRVPQSTIWMPFVNITLGSLPASACAAFENAAGTVDVVQMVKGVSNALNGCAPDAIGRPVEQRGP